MSDQRCDGCYFYRVRVTQLAEYGGECRAKPPVRLPRMFDKTATAGSRVRDESLIWGWPFVAIEDWCGDYAPKAKEPD